MIMTRFKIAKLQTLDADRTANLFWVRFVLVLLALFASNLIERKMFH